MNSLKHPQILKLSIAAVFILLTESALGSPLSEIDCMKGWITAVAQKYGNVEIEDGLKQGLPYRYITFSSDTTEEAAVVFSETKRLVIFALKPKNRPLNAATDIKLNASFEKVLQLSRQNNEGCGATTALSITNPKLARAIRGELTYPSNFNVSKLNSNWISRLNLELFYQKKNIIESKLELAKEKFSDIDDKRQRTIAGIEAIKAAADIAIISKTDPVDIFNPGVSAALIVAQLGGMDPSISKITGVKETISTPAADLMKASADFMYFSTNMSANKSSLVTSAANGVKAYLGFTEQSEGWTRGVESLSSGISCILDRARISSSLDSCVAGQIELIAKASTDIQGSISLALNSYNYHALASALDYMRAYYISAGDANSIYQATGGLSNRDLPSIAKFYNKKNNGINEKLFITTVEEFTSLINTSTQYYRGKLER